MTGPLEIVIVVVFLVLIFGYRRIPAAGRWAGTNLRELIESVKGLFGDRADPKELARSAGKGVREARALRDELTGKGGDDESDESASRTESR